jgi:hypothetical protein
LLQIPVDDTNLLRHDLDIETDGARKMITIPTTETIRQRLVDAGLDALVVEKLGAKLGSHAGQEKHPAGIPVMIALASYDVCKDLPGMAGKIVAMSIDAKSREIEAALTGGES